MSLFDDALNGKLKEPTEAAPAVVASDAAPAAAEGNQSEDPLGTPASADEERRARMQRIAEETTKHQAEEDAKKAAATSDLSRLAGNVGMIAGGYSKYRDYGLSDGYVKSLLEPGNWYAQGTAPAKGGLPVMADTYTPMLPKAPPPSAHENLINSLREDQANADKTLQAKITAVTGVKNPDLGLLTQDQADLMRNGKRGPDDSNLRTSGRERELGHNYTTAKEAGATSFLKDVYAKAGLDPNLPLYQSGEMVPVTRGGITVLVPYNVAVHDSAQESANAHSNLLDEIEQHRLESQQRNDFIDRVKWQQELDAWGDKREQEVRDRTDKTVAEKAAIAQAQSNAAKDAVLRNQANAAGFGKRVVPGMINGAMIGVNAADMAKNAWESGEMPSASDVGALGVNMAGLALKNPYVGMAAPLASLALQKRKVTPSNVAGAAVGAGLSMAGLGPNLLAFPTSAKAATLQDNPALPPDVQDNLALMAENLSPRDFEKMRDSYLANYAKYGGISERERLLGHIRSGQRGGINPNTLLPN